MSVSQTLSNLLRIAPHIISLALHVPVAMDSDVLGGLCVTIAGHGPLVSLALYGPWSGNATQALQLAQDEFHTSMQNLKTLVLSQRHKWVHDGPLYPLLDQVSVSYSASTHMPRAEILRIRNCGPHYRRWSGSHSSTPTSSIVTSTIGAHGAALKAYTALRRWRA